MEGYKASATETGLVITMGDRELAVNIPDFKDLGIDADADTYHNYVQIDRIEGYEHLDNANHVWRNLQEEPFPTMGFMDRPDVVCEGEVSGVPILGDVRHHVDHDNHVVVNVTEDNHMLHPGVVVRHLFVEGGEAYIASVGIGNGPYQGLNNMFSNVVWGGNASRIGRESVYEDNQRPVEPLSSEAMHAALEGPMSDEFLMSHPEVAALKPWVDASCGRVGPHYDRFVDTYNEIKTDGGYHLLHEGVELHQQNMSEALQPAPAVDTAPVPDVVPVAKPLVP